MSDSDDDVRAEFDEAVNMTAKQLENWLETDESRSVGRRTMAESRPATAVVAGSSACWASGRTT